MKYRRFMVVSDIHGSEMDEGACAAALKFKMDFRPEVAVIAGDLWDFAAIRKGASEEERAVSMREDFECGRDFAREFFDGVKGEKHLMLGNHDVRVYDLAGAADAARADLGARMVADVESVAKRAGAKLWPYDARSGVLELGKLSVIHGFHTGASACATHSRIYGNVVFGHVHSVESFQTPGLKQREARAIGCLCKLNMDYANRKTGKLRWAHGFAYGLLFANGEYQLEQARYIGKTLWANPGTPKAY